VPALRQVANASPGKPRSRFYEVAHRIARRFEPPVAAAFLAAITKLQRQIDEAALRSGVASKNLHLIDAGVATGGDISTILDEAEMEAALRRAAQATGIASADVLADATDLDVRFNATHPNVVLFARTQVAELVVQVGDDVREAIRIVVALAQQQGLTTAQQARAIREVVGLPPNWSKAPLNLGQELREGRFTQSRRLSATDKAQINSRLARGTVDEAFIARMQSKYSASLINRRALNIARTECLTADTLVDAAVVRAVFRRWYAGDVVQVRTTNGREFTATPNHPMLTRRGWVAAGELRDSDDLICHDRQQRARPAGHENVHAGPARIGEIFNTLATIGLVERKTTGKPDFHGDGMNGEVEIAHADGCLRIGNFAPLGKPLLQDVLAPAGMVGTGFCDCDGLLASNQSLCVRCASQRYARATGYALYHTSAYAEALSDFGRGATRLVQLCDVFGRQVIAPVGNLVAGHTIAEPVRFCVTPGYPSRFDDIGHPVDACTHARGYGGATEARTIEVDRVSSVGVRSFRGHIYNLETPAGYFNISGGAYTGNTLRASHHGQHESWKQATRQGVLPATARRVWIVTPDARLRPEHAAIPRMNPDGVGLDEPFRTPDGDFLNPPIDPNCRCGVGLIFPGLAGVL
jgi:hypothetical protein